MPDRPPNATAASLLGFLHDGPMTGWDLVATARRRIGDFWSLTQSQVYRELVTLADKGLIDADARGPRDRRPYRITAAGRAAFARWVDQEAGTETIRFPLLLTMQFGRHLRPGRLKQMVTRHRAMHAARLAEYERHLEAGDAHGDEPPDAYRQATLQFGLAYERAVLAWFDALPPEVLQSEGGSTS